VQAISVCPGTRYSVSFVARRPSNAGTGSATLSINGEPMAGGVIAQSNTYVRVTGATWTVPANTYVALLAIEFTFTGNGVKDVYVDSITLTPQGTAP
jgi:hypothetical protein